MSTDNNVKIIITDIQRFCMHDGPGIRTTVFFKGCPLRCAWCHNPETQKKEPQLLFDKKRCIYCGGCAAVCENGGHKFEGDRELDREGCISCFACADNCPTKALEVSGEEKSVDEIMNVVERDRSFYGKKGGLTISGGEPLMQGAGAIALLRAAKEKGFTTTVETCGYVLRDVIEEAAKYTDLFLFDVKDTDSARHEKYTGVSNESINENLLYLESIGAKTRLRCILVNGVNSNAEHYSKVRELFFSLKNCEGVDVLPYHAYGGNKSVLLGGADNGKVDWIPTDVQVAEFRKYVTE